MARLQIVHAYRDSPLELEMTECHFFDGVVSYVPRILDPRSQKPIAGCIGSNFSLQEQPQLPPLFEVRAKSGREFRHTALVQLQLEGAQRPVIPPTPLRFHTHEDEWDDGNAEHVVMPNDVHFVTRYGAQTRENQYQPEYARIDVPLDLLLTGDEAMDQPLIQRSIDAELMRIDAMAAMARGAGRGLKKGGKLAGKGMKKGGKLAKKGMKKGGKLAKKGMKKGGKLAKKGFKKGKKGFKKGKRAYKGARKGLKKRMQSRKTATKKKPKTDKKKQIKDKKQKSKLSKKDQAKAKAAKAKAAVKKTAKKAGKKAGVAAAKKAIQKATTPGAFGGGGFGMGGGGPGGGGSGSPMSGFGGGDQPVPQQIYPAPFQMTSGGGGAPGGYQDPGTLPGAPPRQSGPLTRPTIVSQATADKAAQGTISGDEDRYPSAPTDADSDEDVNVSAPGSDSDEDSAASTTTTTLQAMIGAALMAQTDFDPLDEADYYEQSRAWIRDIANQMLIV